MGFDSKGKPTKVMVNIHDSEVVPIIDAVGHDLELGLKPDNVNHKFFHPYHEERNIFDAYPDYSKNKVFHDGYIIHLGGSSSSQ